MNVKMFRDIDELKIWGNEHGFRFHRDPDDKTKYKECLTDDDVDKLETFVRQQQAEIEALKQSKSDGNNKVNSELTDEEIRHIQAQCHLKDVGYDGFIMRFAKAILRKAQEK